MDYLSVVFKTFLGKGETDEIAASEPQTIEAIMLKNEAHISHGDVAHQAIAAVHHGETAHRVLAHALKSIQDTGIGVDCHHGALAETQLN